jgi:hypothetical protein
MLPEELADGRSDPVRIAERAAERVERVIVLNLPAGAPAWNPAWPPEGGRWDGLRRALAADQRFVPVAERTFDASGYRLTVYETSPPPG